jgi:hypothetical protein
LVLIAASNFTFTDRGSANDVVDKIPLTFRNQQEREAWAWTDANRAAPR